MKRIHLIIPILVLLFTTACGIEESVGALSPTPEPSLTASPTRTKAPTRTPTQSLTLTPTLARTPSQTPTVTPTVGEMLPVITNSSDWWHQYNTPVPVITPDLGWEAYHLRDWTEADAFALIRSLELYAHQNDGIGAAHGRLESLPSTYALVELAIRELQFRFPETEFMEDLNWRLVLANNLQGEVDLDGWMLEKIENELNQGHIKTDELNSLLLEQGFMVAEVWPTPGLFGDGSEGQVYRVQAVDAYGDRGIIFAIRKQRQNSNYEVLHIYSEEAPGTLAMMDRIVEVQDHNHNGLSEVVLESIASSGSMCDLYVLIFEWREDQFVELTRGGLYSNECLDWNYGEPDYYGNDTISVNKFGLGRTNIYAWNGEYYELEDIVLSGRPIECTFYTDLLGAWSDYERGIAALQRIVQEWPDEYDSKFGGICRDYLRFQIGLDYASHNRRSNARTILQDLAASPTDPTMTIFSSVAQTFLSNYNTRQDIYPGCVTAQAAYEAAFSSPQENYYEFWQSSNVCPWQLVFPTLFLPEGPIPAPDPVSWLQAKGVSVIASKELDVDGDGDLDWLVAISESNSSPDVWVLLTADQSIRTFVLEVYGSNDISAQNGFEAKTYVSPETGEVLLLLHLEEDFDIYRISESQVGETVRQVLYEFYVQGYEFKETNLGWILEVSSDTLSQEPRWSDFYMWDRKMEKFRHLPFYDNELFTENAFDDSLPYLERLVAYLHANPDSNIWDKERYLYLLGLAYELTGESDKAVQLYWEIWNNYPESGYARMACSKITYCIP